MTGAARRLATGHALLAGLLITACAPVMDAAPAPATAAPPPAAAAPAPQGEVGGASYYARHFSGRRMANGRRFDPRSDSVAHRTLPFGTVVQVTNLDNGRTVTATVEDRGPFHRSRVIDLSPRLAADLDMIRAGVARVEVTPVNGAPVNGAPVELAEAPE
ncbi:septal ring lytic transglycosylase RlpA family protein [Muricoccus radiodurans]|uniref:septal ring lytic transglycosylase RlpA family protein n=1 Tax=Muricoccus radiodurans TaxID=2231721 RepID=UPI003CE88312